MRKTLVQFFCLALAITVLSGCSYTGTITANCASIYLQNVTFKIDYPNGGPNTEILQVTITDGYGTVIEDSGPQSSKFTTQFVGTGRIPVGVGSTKLPITFTFYNPPGNGQPARTSKFVIPACTGGPGESFTDGRCNIDADAPVVVYPDNKGGYDFYAIYKGLGRFAMNVSKAELAKNPAKDANYLIEGKDGAQLYRLTDGQLQVNRLKPDGTTYTYRWTVCGTSKN